MPMPKKSKTKTPADRKATILWPFLSFAEEGIDELVAYLLHVCIDDRAIKYAGGTAEAAILNHYRIGTSDHFDIEKAAADLDLILRSPGASPNSEPNSENRAV